MEARFEKGGIKKVAKDYTAKQERDDYWVKYRDGTILISISILLDKLFNPILEQIIAHVEQLLTYPKVKDTKHIFVVGGFAESQILQNALYELGKRRNICVTIPLRPGLGVVMGAVMFGLAPERITSRSSKYTYGCGTTTSEVSGHPPHRIETDQAGVKQLGLISIDIADTTGGKNRPIEVSMKFGGTEIEITAEVVHSGEIAHATVNF